MSSRRTIIVNTTATYTRSVIAAGLTLFSSRWVLAALGEVNYGLFAVAGSIIMFITFLNGVMAASESRHFAFAIGRGDSEEANKWFNTSVGIHLILPGVLIMIGWPIGEYCIRHVFTIPVDRIQSCLWVFRISLIEAFTGMVSIPYIAMFSARQRIAELAFWGTIQSVLMFVSAYMVTRVSCDRLLFWAGCAVTIGALIQTTQIIRASFLFTECRLDYGKWFDKNRFREIFSFASWSLIGTFGMILRDQGSVILINLNFGPIVNAAFSIANRVSSQTNQLATAMIGAFAPEITAREGRGDRTRMLSLAQSASKFGTILVLLFAVPLIVEMDYVLRLWLIKPPPYTAIFCRLILVTFVLDRLSTGYMLAVNAHGKIAAYQATLGTCLILTLPLAWISLKLGAPAASVGIAFVATMAAVSTGRVFWARKLLAVPVRSWMTEVVFPAGTVALAALSAVMLPHRLLPPSFLRLVVVTVTGMLTIMLTAWFLALDDDKRNLVKQNAMRLLEKAGVWSRS